MDNNFLKVDYELFKLGLSPTEVLVLSYIISYTSSEKIFYASNQFIADTLGLTEKAVSRSIKTISNYQAVTIIGGKGRNRSIMIDNKIELGILRKPLPKKEIKTPPVEKDNTSTNDTYETTFINNAGKELKVDQKHIKFFNEIILKKRVKEYINKLENCSSDVTLNMEIEECKYQYESRI